MFERDERPQVRSERLAALERRLKAQPAEPSNEEIEQTVASLRALPRSFSPPVPKSPGEAPQPPVAD